MKERVDESISVLFICPVLLRTTRMRMQRMEESGGGWSRIRRQIFWWINGQLTDGSGFVVSPNPDGRAESFSAPFPEYSSSLSLPLSSSLFFLSHCFYLLGQREEKEERQRLFFLFFFMCVCTRSFSFTLSLSLSAHWLIYTFTSAVIDIESSWMASSYGWDDFTLRHPIDCHRVKSVIKNRVTPCNDSYRSGEFAWFHSFA